MHRMRLDCVDELLGNEDLAANIDQCLKKLPQDLDKCTPRRRTLLHGP